MELKPEDLVTLVMDEVDQSKLSPAKKKELLTELIERLDLECEVLQERIDEGRIENTEHEE